MFQSSWITSFNEFFSQIDRRLLPIMGFLYLMSHIDRANIGNAKIEGMDEDLGLKGNQYNIASTIFFVPYIIFGQDPCFFTSRPINNVSRNPFQHGIEES